MKHDPLSVALRDARVPRYTSFPPANRFTASIGPADAGRWIAEIPAGSAISLYVHVPFCRRLCWFCACRTQGTQSDAPLDRYLHHLGQEIDLVRKALPSGVTVGRLHLGGGTPTILSPDRIDALSDRLRAAFTFDPDAEISVEIDPCDCDDARLDALVRAGLSRVSVGVQDFDPRVQETIGRMQSLEVTQDLVAGVRQRGVASLNVDLVYGLPYQTEETLRRTLDQVIGMAPERLALFGYAHVPWMAQRQRLIPDAALPGPDERLHLARVARDVLVSAGYVAVGIDHFALPGDDLAMAAETGRLHRNFQGYTTDDAETLIGLGPSAISSCPEGIAQNSAATGDWQRRIASGQIATARGHRLSPMDRLAAEVIERLMCDGRADLEAIAAAHGVETAALVQPADRAIGSLPGIGRRDGAMLISASPETVRLLATFFDPGFTNQDGVYSQAS